MHACWSRRWSTGSFSHNLCQIGKVTLFLELKELFFWMHQSDAGCMTVLRHSLTKLIQYSVLCLSNWQHVSVVTGLDIMTEQFFLNKIVVHGKGVHCLCSVNCSGIWCELFKTTELHLYRLCCNNATGWVFSRSDYTQGKNHSPERDLTSDGS